MAATVEPDLIEQAADGDHAAFDAIVRCTYPEMYGFAFRLVGNEHDARDVLQDAYLRAYRSMHTFRGDSSFTTWLYRIVANVAYTHLRKRKRQRTEQLDDVDEPVSSLHLPEDLSQTAHLRDELKEHLMELPPEQRVVVVMKDVYDLPHEVIAKDLGITVTAAKLRLHRARKKLRAAIESRRERDADS